MGTVAVSSSSNTPTLHHSHSKSLSPMETILLLANTEADGTLAKPALEALGAAKT